MEPMTLGSPVNSANNQQYTQTFASPIPNPATPTGYSAGTGHSGIGYSANQPGGMGSQTLGQTGFLPGYLMGDCTQQGAGRIVSPTKLNRSISQAPSGHLGAQTHLNGTPGTPVPPGQRINGFLTPTTPAAPSTPGAALRASADKPGGPPTSGLFSTPRQRLRNGLDQPSPATPKISTPIPTTPHLSFGGTPKNFNTTSHELSQSSCQDGTTWVTVFGFPPSAASYILKQFSQCGTVLQHHIPANGNWMHIRFQTRTQAQSALSRSGRILGGTLMIGVLLCQDADIQAMNGDGLLDQSKTNLSSVSTFNTSVTTPNRSSIRPLAQAYKAAHNEHEVSLNSTTASQNDGIVTRAMEYIFGW